MVNIYLDVEDLNIAILQTGRLEGRILSYEQYGAECYSHGFPREGIDELDIPEGLKEVLYRGWDARAQGRPHYEEQESQEQTAPSTQ